jgi:hypothetical protein
MTAMAAGDVINLQLFGIIGAANLIGPGGAELLVEQIH